jgi:hypothetical protein
MAKIKIDKFYAYARERQSVHLRRQAGLPREQWTKDPILQTYRFCNVFREQDKTTAWFREHVRDPLRSKSEVLLATVMFRMLNRITTGEAIFDQLALGGGTAWARYLKDGDIREIKRAIVSYCGKGPYVTGAYIISSPPGMKAPKKLNGMMKIIDDFNKKSGWKSWAGTLLVKEGGSPLEGTWSWLREQPYFGNFHSYEIVTDLRHTSLLDSAPDIMLWCNLGPGAKRGINRVMDRDKNFKVNTEQALDEMRNLLPYSKDADYWPQSNASKNFRDGAVFKHHLAPFKEQWPSWEMRDIEHTLCEFDKYSRVANKETTKKGGLATPRGVFK